MFRISQESALSLRRSSVPSWAALALLCAACGKSEPHPAPTVDELREFIINGAAPEEASNQLLGDVRNSHRELLDQLEDAAKQPKVKGLFLRLTDGFGGA